MQLNWFDRVGEWNPQLFRELKGLFKSRNLFLAVAGSVLGQCLIIMIFSQQHCLKYTENTCVELNWSIQWEFVFRTLNWILPFLLLVSGVYSIACDLSKEVRRGTLNFIRLSPQSSQSILTGKILGVPALLYLGIALAVPLHWVSALAADEPLSWIFGLYALWGVGCGLFYTTACFYSLLWSSAQSEPKTVAGGASLIALLLGLPYISLIDFSFRLYRSDLGLGTWKWFLLPLGREPELACTWVLITFSVATYWIWQAANRLFRNPSATLISKPQSYWLVSSLQVWLLGFVLPELNSVSSSTQFYVGFSILFVLNPIGFIILNAALSPKHQALQDWACYRHKSSSRNKRFFNRTLMQDLIWGEKSPTLVAIAINLLITAIIWVPWILLGTQAIGNENFTPQSALLGLLLTVNVILIYVAIAQLMLFMKHWQRLVWSFGTVGTQIGLLTVILCVWQIDPLQLPFLWLFSPLPVLALTNASATTVFLGLLAQLSVLGLLTLQLTRQLHKAGESPSKALFAGHSSFPIGDSKQ
jgi:hypothetical protein